MQQEATVLLCYIGGRQPSDTQVQLYLEALQRHAVSSDDQIDPIVLRSTLLLGALDAASRLLHPHCILQKKLLIAAAIVECDPSSADLLLPLERGRIGIFFSLIGLGLRVLLKWIFALPLLLIPSFLKRNAGPR